MSNCRSCGAEIWWAKAQGKSKDMPLDSEPCDEGNIVYVDAGQVRVFKTAMDAERAYPGEKRFLSHFVTCKDATKWRKK